MFRCLICLFALGVLLAPGRTHAQNDPTYLHLSDIHLDLSGQSSDTDPELWSITKDKLRSILGGPEPPTFLLYTGDLPGHYECHNDDCSLDPSQVPAHNANVRAVLSDLYTLVANAGIPLLYMPGNNDSLAGDYFSFTDRGGKTPFSLVPTDQYPAPNAAKPCGEAPCMVSNPDPALGYYSARPVAGLRVIALNSVVLGREYHEVDGKSQLTAGDEQMDWLKGQLKDAAGQEKVLIAMHIPPGNDAYAVSHGKTETWLWARHPDDEGDQPRDHRQHWLDRFLDLVSAHPETVIGLAYGHTHLDELRRLHNRQGEVIEVAVSAPGITTNHGNNPGFKVVRYDADSKELLDFVTYYTQRGNATWGDQQYVFDSLFGCSAPTESTLLGCLTAERYRSTAAVDQVMDEFFTVMAGPPPYDTSSGIEVEYGQ